MRGPSTSWRYLVLASGVAGAIGFFVPFAHFLHDDGALAGSPSGFTIVFRGFPGCSPTLARLVIVAYGPSLLLVLNGVAAAVDDQLARPAGAIACLAGVTSTAFWILYILASNSSELVQTAPGGHALLLAGMCGSIGGVLVHMTSTDPASTESGPQ